MTCKGAHALADGLVQDWSRRCGVPVQCGVCHWLGQAAARCLDGASIIAWSFGVAVKHSSTALVQQRF